MEALIFEKRMVCGRPLYYPVCSKAIALMKLARRKGLEPAEVASLIDSGIKIQV